MDTAKIAALLEEHGDGAMMPLVVAADEAGWGDVYEYLRIGYEDGLSRGGLWQCEHCGCALEDPAHPHHETGCHILDDGTGCGDTILCDECYDTAKAARAKIVVQDEYDGDGEVAGASDDDSALTTEEKTLASYLAKNQEGNARIARSMIGDYPREERRQLHRYQDQIDADAAKRGKIVK